MWTFISEFLFSLIERQGKRFAHWTSQAKCLLTGMLPPVFRVPRSFRLTEDIPQHIQAAQKQKDTAEKILDVIKTGKTEKHLKVGWKMHYLYDLSTTIIQLQKTKCFEMHSCALTCFTAFSVHSLS